jgi:hypothetical protein
MEWAFRRGAAEAALDRGPLEQHDQHGQHEQQAVREKVSA